MPTDFGSDISAFPDLDFSGGLVKDQRNVAESIWKRLQTPRGGLVYDLDYGLDVRIGIDESYTASQAATLQNSIAAECEKDERVVAATVLVVFIASSSSLTITIELETADGPFTLVLSVDSLTVTILRSTE